MAIVTDPISRAVATCTVLGISVAENFARTKREIGGVECDDYRLSRFACCLTVLSGDTKKPSVAAAQAYFNLIRRGAEETLFRH